MRLFPTLPSSRRCLETSRDGHVSSRAISKHQHQGLLPSPRKIGCQHFQAHRWPGLQPSGCRACAACVTGERVCASPLLTPHRRVVLGAPEASVLLCPLGRAGALGEFDRQRSVALSWTRTRHHPLPLSPQPFGPCDSLVSPEPWATKGPLGKSLLRA